MPAGEIQIVAGDYESAEAQRIRDGLDSFTMAASRHESYSPVAFFLKPNSGEVAGGILGYEWGGWLYIQYLWVSDDLRGHGFGARLLATAEARAIEHGCRNSYLTTFSFQARPFYERFGYECAGQIDGYPDGHALYFMTKALRRQDVDNRTSN